MFSPLTAIATRARRRRSLGHRLRRRLHPPMLTRVKATSLRCVHPRATSLTHLLRLIILATFCVEVELTTTVRSPSFSRPSSCETMRKGTCGGRGRRWCMCQLVGFTRPVGHGSPPSGARTHASPVDLVHFISPGGAPCPTKLTPNVDVKFMLGSGSRPPRCSPLRSP